LSDLSTKALRPLIRLGDDKIKEKSIEKIKEDLIGEQTVINEQNAKQGAEKPRN
jgi:hypothetical protein